MFTIFGMKEKNEKAVRYKLDGEKLKQNDLSYYFLF